jgi:hypothetical protein
MLTVPLFIVAKKKVSIDIWIKKTWSIYTEHNIIQSQKITSYYLDNTDEPEGHYGNWNKSDTQRQKYCLISLNVESKKATQKQKVEG